LNLASFGLNTISQQRVRYTR